MTTLASPIPRRGPVAAPVTPDVADALRRYFNRLTPLRDERFTWMYLVIARKPSEPVARQA